MNAAHRRYCGDCGTNLEPVCASCGFENESRDRFCGGCGCGMTQQVHAPVAVPAPRAMTMAMPPPPPKAKPVAQTPTHELDGLFAAPAVKNDGPKLPDANISQDDVDRLFGAVP
jgi:hypothetical protein